MPKSKKHRHMRAYEIWRLISVEQLRAIPLGSDRILKVLERKSPTLPPVKKSQRRIQEKRMGLPRGCYLNSRWMEIHPSWDIWDLVKDVNPQIDIVARNLLAEKAIIHVKGKWYIMIYEVVSGLSKLLRQQVHRDARYEEEKLRNEPLVLSIERRFAQHALRLAKLTNAESSELHTLQNKVSRRLLDIMVIRSRLAFRKTYVYAIAGATVSELHSIKQSLEWAASHPSKLVSNNAESFLMRFAQRLDILYSMDIWREIYWAKWNILEAATGSLEGKGLTARHHLLKAVGHLQKAIDKLSSWSDMLPPEEKKHIVRF